MINDDTNYMEGNGRFRMKAIHNPPIDEVTYIIFKSNESGCILVDPYDMDQIEEMLAQLGCGHPEWVLLTHEHYDHIGAVNQLTEKYHCGIVSSRICAERLKDPRKNMSAYFDALLELHGASNYDKKAPLYSVPCVDVMFEGQDDFLWRGIPFRLTETPGHSPGSICIRSDTCIFTGDSLLRDVPVITRAPGGSRKDYQRITEPYLLNLPKDITVYPGHGVPFRIGESKYLYPKKEDERWV